MNIAFFTNHYHPVVDGVVRSVSTFREELSKRGHNVFVFAQESEDYVDIEPFIFRYPAINLTWPVETPLVMPISPCFEKIIPSLGLDIIHAHHPILMGQTAADQAEKLGVPLVFTFHTRYRDYSHYVPLPIEAVQELVRNSIDSWLINFMRRCHHIVVPTEGIRELLTNEYGVQNQITVVPTGIDLDPFKAADGTSLRADRGWKDDFVVVSAGRLAVEKNFETLLSAFAKAVKCTDHLRLVLVGDGPARDALEKQSAELGITERVSFEGSVPFERMPEYLKAANLFAFASVTETQGLVTLEAMAAGLPVAAVDATGTSDIVEHGRQGFLTPNDSEALGCAIVEIANNRSLHSKFKRAAGRRVIDYEIQRTTKSLLDVYSQAIEAQRADNKVWIENS